MPRIAYVNGRYTSAAEACVHIEDRGYQFGDGVYEVCLVVDGAYWDEEGHLARLDRSLKALSIARPMSERALKTVMAALVRKNRLKTALVYIQVTRGVASRNHPFPEKKVAPSLVMTARAFNLEKSEQQAAAGVDVITAPDIRWGRVDIKTINLLPNVLAKQEAQKAGAAEAWLVKGDTVTEGASSNAWIVTRDGELVTHPLSNEILGGITRQAVIECAEALQMRIVERAFTTEEAVNAAEAFLTSATGLVMPVVRIDGKPIGEGKPGPVSRRLRNAYIDRWAVR
ncbi:MAG: D-amino-acid transaminase [Alphaproteobacteria bacterium]|nr:D-amino-acid transaminase [Alphaproteobacteria bacterium]